MHLFFVLIWFYVSYSGLFCVPLEFVPYGFTLVTVVHQSLCYIIILKLLHQSDLCSAEADSLEVRLLLTEYQ